jgi:hypothetical protein
MSLCQKNQYGQYDGHRLPEKLPLLYAGRTR